MATATPTAVTAAAADAASPKTRGTGRGRPHRRRCYRDRKSRAAGANAGADKGSEESARPKPDPQVEVEYVPEKPNLGADNPLLLGAFVDVFEIFCLTDHTASAHVEVSRPSIFHLTHGYADSFFDASKVFDGNPT